MTLQSQIDALLAEAAPLRLLPDGDAADLGRIVDQINALRARQAAGEADEPDSPSPLPIDEPKKRGRPRKVAALEEGADA